MSIINKNTLVEKHNGIYVKREDLCANEPWPHFSKIRGVLAHVKSREENLIGVLDTFHSQAGWAVAAACQLLNKTCINFYPKYTKDKDGELRKGQRESKELRAILKPLSAGRSAILYHAARKYMKKKGGYLMPNALKLKESVEETAKEVLGMSTSKYHNIVIPISSGTIAAGVLTGLILKDRELPTVYLHLGYSRSHQAVRAYIREYAPDFPSTKIKLIDEGYKYKDTAKGKLKPPFRCSPYYDLKAWQWLNANPLDGKTLFWNIG